MIIGILVVSNIIFVVLAFLGWNEAGYLKSQQEHSLYKVRELYRMARRDIDRAVGEKPLWYERDRYELQEQHCPCANCTSAREREARALRLDFFGG